MKAVKKMIKHHKSHNFDLLEEDDTAKLYWMCLHCGCHDDDERSFYRCSKYNLIFGIRRYIWKAKSSIYGRIADYFRKKKTHYVIKWAKSQLRKRRSLEK